MAFVAVATTVGTTVGLTGIGATLAGGAILGAGAGGLYSAITKDGNILDSMLTGGLIGGAVGGIGGAMFPGAAGIAPAGGAVTPAAAAAAPSTAAVPTANVMTTTPAMQAAAANAANLEAAALAEGSTVAGMAPAANTGLAANTVMPTSMTFTPPANTVADAAGKSLGKQMLGYGLAGTAAMQLLGNKPTVGAGPAPYPGDIRPYEFASRPTGEMGESPYPTTQYDVAGNPVLDTRERSYFDQGFTAYQPYRAGTSNPNIPLPVKTAADGGLMAAYPMSKYIPGAPNVETYTMGLAAGGDVEDMDSRRQKGIMNMVKSASNKELENALNAMSKEEMLRKVSPDYAQYMNPSVPGLVAAAQPFRMADGGYTGYQGYENKENAPRKRISNLFGDALVASLTPRDQSGSVNVLGGATSGGDSGSESSYESNPVLMGMYNKLSEQPDYQFTRPELIAGWQAYNPYAYSYSPTNQKYLAATPNEQQLSLFKQQISEFMADDARRKAEASQEQQASGAAAGGLMAIGGRVGGKYNLGSYSDGGRMLKGPGDGMSDDIPGIIGDKQPARLADGEFVVPADVVSHLGNGSTDAGAKRLYAMMDRVRKARTGTKKQGKQIKAEKYLPK